MQSQSGIIEFLLGAVRGASLEQRDETACIVPDGFDWQTYLLYHPDIRDRGIVDEPRAREHYCTTGQEKKLLYKRLDVTLRYTACTGRSMLATFSYLPPILSSLTCLQKLERRDFQKPKPSKLPSQSPVYIENTVFLGYLVRGGKHCDALKQISTI